MAKNQETIEQKIIAGALRGLWLLFSLPFRRSKKSLQGFSQSSRTNLDRESIKNKWQEIKNLASLGGESRFRNAIIEADKLLDLVLQSLGMGGETFGDRLKSGEDRFSHSAYDAIWQAHKIRNNIVHNVDYELTSFTAQDAMAKYESALKELGAL